MSTLCELYKIVLLFLGATDSVVSDTDAGEIEAIWEQCFYLERGRLNVEGRVASSEIIADRILLLRRHNHFLRESRSVIQLLLQRTTPR